jgi:AGCS family alanine or glycine:cation symporter
LSSNVWTEKFNNNFSRSDLIILAGNHAEANPAEKEAVSRYIIDTNESNLYLYTGDIIVENGKIINDGFTIIHNRSFAEEITVSSNSNLFSGTLQINNGSINNSNIVLNGKSLVHSVVLTTEAFKKGLFGDFGQYIVSIGLLLFAFSTVISWSYYGDRAMTYLFGSSSVIYYRIAYIIGFIAATLVDTTVIWTIANVAIVIMTLPNLLGILFLQNEMKSSLNEYIVKFNTENPNEKPVS